MKLEQYKRLRTELLILQARLEYEMINNPNSIRIQSLKRLIAGLKSQVARRTKARGIY